jgi:hypothetical protein
MMMVYKNSRRLFHKKRISSLFAFSQPIIKHQTKHKSRRRLLVAKQKGNCPGDNEYDMM